MEVRVLLVDDHQMFREGLRALLESRGGVRVVGESSDGREAVATATGPAKPEIVIMDASMPGLNGMEATRQITSQGRVRVIALSAHKDRQAVSAMLDAGASAYVLKESAANEILTAIAAVQRGRKFLSPAVAELVIDGFVHRADPAPAEIKACPLAPREREILQLLAEGLTSKDIAQGLHLSAKTVETHRRNIMRKLRLHSIATLTKYAIRQGLTSVED